MCEHTGRISSYQLLIIAAYTPAARWKVAAPEQLTGAHLYLDISSGVETIFPFAKCNSATVGVWGWIGNFISHITGHVITYPYLD